jgi:hypothetical protein
VLSLILCLATVGLWVRSYWQQDAWWRDSVDKSFAAISNRGVVRIVWGAFLQSDSGGWRLESRAASRSDEPALAFVRTDSLDGKIDVWFLNFPHWLPALLFALAPTYWLLGPWRRQSKRRKLGLCLNCGYDLIATPARCPECGRAPCTVGPQHVTFR